MLGARSDRSVSGCRRRFLSCRSANMPLMPLWRLPDDHVQRPDRGRAGAARPPLPHARRSPPAPVASASASSRARRRERKRTARRFGEANVERRDNRHSKHAQETAAIANGARQLGDRRLTALPLRATDRRRRSRWACAVRQEQASGRGRAVRVALEVQRAGELVFGDGERADAHVKFFGYPLGDERSPRPKDVVGARQGDDGAGGPRLRPAVADDAEAGGVGEHPPDAPGVGRSEAARAPRGGQGGRALSGRSWSSSSCSRTSSSTPESSPRIGHRTGSQPPPAGTNRRIVGGRGGVTDSVRQGS